MRELQALLAALSVLPEGHPVTWGVLKEKIREAVREGEQDPQ